MKDFTILLSMLLIFSGNLFAQNSYSNSTYGLNIDFPEGWKKQMAWSNNEIQKARLFNADAEIVTTITIAVYPSSATECNSVNGDGPSKSWDAQKTRFGQDAQDLKETGTSTIGGIAMKWGTTTFDLFGKHGFTKTYYFGKNDRIYRFTLQTNGGQTVYGEALPKFEESMKTLKVS